MNAITPWLALSFTLLCATGIRAADTSSSTIVRDYTDIVAPADQQAYETGIKNFNECLHQHGFKYTWKAWIHETGNTYAYSYVSDPLSWESFDAMNTAGKACDQALRTAVNPHLKSETSAFFEIKPELSHMPKGMAPTSAFIEVRFFKLKPGHEAVEAFRDAVKKIAAAAEKSNWTVNYMFGEVREGGEDAPDFILVIPAKSWADVGKDPDPSVWKMVENVYGKDDAQAIRKSVNDTVQNESEHVDSYSAELTYTAAH
ncbi:hypothetical protein [Dyella nitratireducens]|uniref:Uncharacterized protein n=1 Tax=Dyella nitratireducens TaxID=1849580 RepID=A0ABQ1GIE9_9GAMM|nr:hypothetical protein [Dyella nitratireducens]GGA44453.1 hypothetical protein GCM10010981_37020 [Dyella nitratireducens]GLQ41741.1 hypothetical protein GCM10007902_15910 [Dyella nitratireducens]